MSKMRIQLDKAIVMSGGIVVSILVCRPLSQKFNS